MGRRELKVMRITKRFVIMVASVSLAVFTSRLLNRRALVHHPPQVAHDSYWDHVIDHYGIPFLQLCITSLYKLYIKFTIFNAIAMVKTKQVVRETECTELLALQEREAARLRDMRARVQALVADDQALRKLLDTFAVEKPHHLEHHNAEQDLHLMELLAFDKSKLAEGATESIDDPREDPVSGKSEYSSVSEAEVEKDCQIKIIEVTNVYKVAYLKHYIKLKRIRRASRHALLKKKMANIKKLLESWQKALNMVMKDHRYIMRRDRDETSEDISASRPLDSDTDTAVDEYNTEWEQPGLYKHYYREPEITDCSGDYPCHDYNDQYYGNCYEDTEPSVCESQEACKRPELPLLLEETSSQLFALQDAHQHHNDSNDCPKS